jgi:hypothetical protein
MSRHPLPMIASWLLLAGTAVAQHAGDILLTRPTPNGPIVTSGGEWVGPYAGRVFDEGIMPSTAPFTTASPGFDSASGTFPAGGIIRYDFVKQLLYWNGSAMATPAATMTLDYQGNRPATVTGTDLGGAAGAVITSVPSNGSFHEHVNYTLTNNAAAGLYGIVLTLGPGAGSTGFTTSEPFLVTFSRGTVNDYATGLATMVDTAFAPVPEPSGIALAAAAAGGGWLALRRSRKARPGPRAGAGIRGR